MKKSLPLLLLVAFTGLCLVRYRKSLTRVNERPYVTELSFSHRSESSPVVLGFKHRVVWPSFYVPGSANTTHH